MQQEHSGHGTNRAPDTSTHSSSSASAKRRWQQGQRGSGMAKHGACMVIQYRSPSHESQCGEPPRPVPPLPCRQSEHRVLQLLQRAHLDLDGRRLGGEPLLLAGEGVLTEAIRTRRHDGAVPAARTPDRRSRGEYSIKWPYEHRVLGCLDHRAVLLSVINGHGAPYPVRN